MGEICLAAIAAGAPGLDVMNRFLRLLRAAPLYGAAWSPVLLLFAVTLLNTGVASRWPAALHYASIYLSPAIILGVPVIAISRRLVNRGFSWRSWPSLGGHVMLALVYSFLWHGAFFGYIYLLGGREAVMRSGGTYWPWMVVQGLFFYGVIAGVASAAQISQHLRERKVAAARSESLRVRAEMQALRGQLDPHFLFNTLHSITALVRIDPPQAEEALVQFGALLRRVLTWKREGTDEVTLADEMMFVDGCLALEQLRLGDRLRVERRFSPEALSCYIPVFSVQPLVENAIRHAIAPQRAGGVLQLAASVNRGRLEIIVADSGPGADPAAVPAATGTGLTAIRQRLQLRHGADATMSVHTSPGHGFAVTLSLPVVMEPVLNTFG